jgi:hypothetical protein
VTRILSAGEVTSSEVAPGAVLEWMALRKGGPTIMRRVRWDGRRPFKAFRFEIDDNTNTYTFVVPEDCGNFGSCARCAQSVGRAS